MLPHSFSLNLPAKPAAIVPFVPESEEVVERNGNAKGQCGPVVAARAQFKDELQQP